MEHLNYSRQLAKSSLEILKNPSIHPELRSRLSRAVALHGASAKFILPDGGRLYDDLEFKALDESVPLRLPYPEICIEYKSNGRDREELEPICIIDGQPQYESPDSVRAPKRVAYAKEIDGWIEVTVAFWTQHDAMWRILPLCAIPMVGYLDRSVDCKSAFFGRVAIKAAYENPQIPMSDYADELGALLCFLNILRCSNVKTERSETRCKAGKKIKSALPFDAYHVLTIDAPGKSGDGASTGSHRSPREHLRRGHIRRMASGRTAWVNATVVSAGCAGGRVSKDYAMRCAA